VDSVSLTSLPMVLAPLVGAALLALGALRAARRRRPGAGRWLPTRTLLWGLTVAGGLALGVRASGLVPYDFPHVFVAWVAVPAAIGAGCVLAWRSLPGRHRVGATGACALALVFAFLAVNAHYDYWPTLGVLLGRDHSDPLLPSAVLDGTTVTWTSGRSAGALVDVTIPGTVSGFAARRARVWLPPGYRSDPLRPRPAVELVAGTPSWPTHDWTGSMAVDRLADAYAAAHDGEAPILLMVDGNGGAFSDTECVDRPGRAAETYLTVDVREFAARRLHVPEAASAWAIAGYSEGGTCAVTLAVRHPDLYRAFADLSGDVGPNLGGRTRTVRSLFGGSETSYAAHQPLQVLAQRSFPQLSGWFGAGTDDAGSCRAVRQLADAARRAGVEVDEVEGRGGHDFRFWSGALRRALPWLADRLQT
jgi:S-formylglutathione hydrolase FrmB